MTKRKSLGDMSPLRSKREASILKPSPAIQNLKELIDLGETENLYSNINMFLLWNILPSLKELYYLVGMENVKQSIFLQVLFFLQGFHRKNIDFLHTVIYGPPGCGKTTVGKIIGDIYKGLYILSKKSKFKIASRDDFIGQFLGHTSFKTKAFLESCKGDCLFIDEVYSLAPRQNDRDSFSKEAIDTINQFLSENKENFCCIIAGYEKEVKQCFFGMNKGLERRFPWIHYIKEYTPLELSRIYLKMLREQQWFFSEDEKTLEKIIKENKDLFKYGGGSIETFITKCKISHSFRVFSLEKDYKFVITKEDAEHAVKIINSSKEERKLEKIPDMYI